MAAGFHLHQPLTFIHLNPGYPKFPFLLRPLVPILQVGQPNRKKMNTVQVPQARLWTQPLPPNNPTEEEAGQRNEEKSEKSHLTTAPSASLPSYVTKTTIPSPQTTTVVPSKTSSIQSMPMRTTSRVKSKPTKMWSLEMSTKPSNAKRSTLPHRPTSMHGSMEMSSTSDEKPSAFQTLDEDSLSQESNIVPKTPDFVQQDPFWMSEGMREDWRWEENELTEASSSREDSDSSSISQWQSEDTSGGRS